MISLLRQAAAESVLPFDGALPKWHVVCPALGLMFHPSRCAVQAA
jgi:hypothetical protein